MQAVGNTFVNCFGGQVVNLLRKGFHGVGICLTQGYNGRTDGCIKELHRIDPMKWWRIGRDWVWPRICYFDKLGKDSPHDVEDEFKRPALAGNAPDHVPCARSDVVQYIEWNFSKRHVRIH